MRFVSETILLAEDLDFGTKDRRLSWRRLADRLDPRARIKRFPVSFRTGCYIYPLGREAFPCRTVKAQEVIRVLPREIILTFGSPKSVQSDNCPSCKATVMQGYRRPWE